MEQLFHDNALALCGSVISIQFQALKNPAVIEALLTLPLRALFGDIMTDFGQATRVRITFVRRRQAVSCP
jgi:hypothetical protein